MLGCYIVYGIQCHLRNIGTYPIIMKVDASTLTAINLIISVTS